MDNVTNEDDAQLGMDLGEMAAGSEAGRAEAGAAGKCGGAVRLRQPERRQMAVGGAMSGRSGGGRAPGAAGGGGGGALGRGGVLPPIKAREGVAGRDATDPQLLVALWLYACVRGIGSARELARQCEENAAFRWLCGGVTVNHRLLSDFRTDHGEALDQLFTQVIASLVDKGVVKVSRISQDGMRVRVGAGASSFRREERLGKLLEEAQQHVAELQQAVGLAGSPGRADGAASGGAEAGGAGEAAALAAGDCAIAGTEEAAGGSGAAGGQGKRGEKIRKKEPRVSTTDAEARVMKMPNGGFNPAVNVQLATRHREPRHCGGGGQHGRLGLGRIERADAAAGGRAHGRQGGRAPDGRRLPADRTTSRKRPTAGRGAVRAAQAGAQSREAGPGTGAQAGDSDAVQAWKQRMRSEEGKEIYKQRAATSETVNADLRTYRGLGRITVRGLAKARCVALWCALAYNLMHFAPALLA